MIKKIYYFLRYGLLKRPINSITSPIRLLPECTVIGSGKSGTTALYHYLGQHPCVRKSAYDELGFYNDNFHLGINWYKSLFPTTITKKKIIREYGKFLTYDVTPQYLRDPSNAKKMFDYFPKMKLIVLLRNPIDKTYSAYIARRNANALPIINNKPETFDHFVDKEIQFISEYESRNGKIDDNYFKNIVPQTILARGFYAQFLKKWFEIYEKNQFLIIPSYDLAKKTSKTLSDIFKFLDLPLYDIPDTSKQNTQFYEPMEIETRKKLINFYKKYNNELYTLLDMHFDWDK